MYGKPEGFQLMCACGIVCSISFIPFTSRNEAGCYKVRVGRQNYKIVLESHRGDLRGSSSSSFSLPTTYLSGWVCPLSLFLHLIHTIGALDEKCH